MSESPKFHTPPVTEVFCGVQFDPLPGFSVAYYGRFWEQLKQTYPKSIDQAPVMQNRGQSEFITGVVTPRIFLITESENRLLQLQPDRFMHNWRKQGIEQEGYPGFTSIADEFTTQLDALQTFLETENIGLPVIRAIELSFVNFIPAGDLWQNSNDIHQVFPTFSWQPAGFHETNTTTYLDDVLSTPVGLSWNMTFPGKKPAGGLHVMLTQCVFNDTQQGVLDFRLKFTGLPEETSPAGIRQWLNEAEKAMTQAFVALTSPKAHQHWELHYEKQKAGKK